MTEADDTVKAETKSAAKNDTVKAETKSAAKAAADFHNEGPDENLTIGRDGALYVLVDRDAGQQVRMTRGGAKAVCRFLMQELNIVEAKLGNGEDVFEKDAKLKGQK